MRDHLSLRTLLAVGASLTTLSLAAPVFADEAAAPAANDSSNVVQTLVVTAQRKEEAIQDVPIAVSAFSSDSLKKENIVGAQDLLHAIPNVNYARGNFSGYNFQIRGIGTKSVGTSADAGISVHENDIPLISNNLGDADFFDVERVEVDRGPQGTLFGRNATGGVVNVLTNMPTDRYQSELTGDYGNYSAERVKGFVNIPLTDTFAVRAAGTYLKRDGFAQNTYLNTSEDGRDLWSSRITAQWKPTESFKSYVLWEHFNENDDRDRVGKQLCIHDPGLTSVGGVPTNAGTQGNLSQGCANGSIYGANNFSATNTLATLAGQFAAIPSIGLASGDLNANTVNSSNLREWQSYIRPQYRSKEDLLTWHTQFDLTNDIVATSETAYNQSRFYSRADYDRDIPAGTYNSSFSLPAVAGVVGAPVTNGVVSDPQTGISNTLLTVDQSENHTREFSEEFRLQSNFKGPLNFSGGVNFVDYNDTSDYYVISNGLTVPAEAINLSTILAGGSPPISPVNFSPTGNGPTYSNYYDNRQQYRLRSYSAFGEAYYQIRQDLKLTVGVRYNEDRKWEIASPVDLYTPLLGAAGTPFAQTKDFSEATGRINLVWSPQVSFTDKTTVYATLSRGYKPGGINPGIIAGSGVPTSFAPEFVTAFEAGTKNSLLNNSLILNATAFYYDYKGYQISAIVDKTSVNSNVNANVSGVELESIWEPIRHLRLNGSLGFLHTEITSGSTPDQLNLTNGDPTLTVVKALGGANCVQKTQDVATVQELINLANSTPTNVQTATAKAYANAVVGKGLNALFNSPNYFITCNGIQGLTAADTPGSQLAQVLTGLGLPQLTGFATGTGWTSTLNSAGNNVALNGRQLPNSPDFTFNIGIQYIIPLSEKWVLTPRADYYYQASSYARVFNTAHDNMKAYDVTNASIELNNREWGLNIQAYVRNVFDKVYIQDQYLTDASSGLYTNVFLGDPRTYGVSVTKKF